MSDLPEQVEVFDCVEYQHLDIDPSLWFTGVDQTVFNSEINGKDVLRVNFVRGVPRLQATSFVGVIPINNRVVLRVSPRVPLSNLTRMVIDTGHGVLALSAFRDYGGRGTADDWAMDRYTDALLGYIDTALDAGLIRDYERRYGEGHYPHGRLELSGTLQRFAARGVTNKASYSWFERTIDTPANRCVRAAMEIVHDYLVRSRSKPRKGDDKRLRRLAGQFAAFEEVSVDDRLLFLEDGYVAGSASLPDSRAYYRPLIDLSLLIVKNVGIALDIGGDDVRMGSLLINTNDLFEKFVRVSLAKEAQANGWGVDVLDGNTEGRVDLYDVPVDLPAPFGEPLQAMASRDAGKAQPDVVLRTPAGRVLLVAEVKNTIITDAALPDRDHVHQAVTYAIRYDLTFTMLIHPWSAGSKGLVYVGRIKDIDVYDYRLDLSLEDGVDAALMDMAGALSRLAGVAVIHRPAG